MISENMVIFKHKTIEECDFILLSNLAHRCGCSYKAIIRLKQLNSDMFISSKRTQRRDTEELAYRF